MDFTPPGSSVHGILWARILEWLAIPSSGDLPDPGIEPQSLMSPPLTGGFFTTSTIWEAQHVYRKNLKINIYMDSELRKLLCEYKTH